MSYLCNAEFEFLWEISDLWEEKEIESPGATEVGHNDGVDRFRVEYLFPGCRFKIGGRAGNGPNAFLNVMQFLSRDGGMLGWFLKSQPEPNHIPHNPGDSYARFTCWIYQEVKSIHADSVRIRLGCWRCTYRKSKTEHSNWFHQRANQKSASPPLPHHMTHKRPEWQVGIAPAAEPTISKFHDKPDMLHPVQIQRIKTDHLFLWIEDFWLLVYFKEALEDSEKYENHGTSVGGCRNCHIQNGRCHNGRPKNPWIKGVNKLIEFTTRVR